MKNKTDPKTSGQGPCLTAGHISDILVSAVSTVSACSKCRKQRRTQHHDQQCRDYYHHDYRYEYRYRRPQCRDVVNKGSANDSKVDRIKSDDLNIEGTGMTMSVNILKRLLIKTGA